MRKIVDVIPFFSYPPISGGHSAVYFCNLELSKRYRIFQYSFGFRRDVAMKNRGLSVCRTLFDNYRDYQHLSWLAPILAAKTRRGSGTPFFQASRLMEWSRTGVLSRELASADLVTVQFPWQFEWVYHHCARSVPIVLILHNIEALLIDKVNPGKKVPWKQQIREQEEFAVAHSDAVIVFTEEDKAALRELYGVDLERVHVVPVGVDTARFNPPGDGAREDLKEKMGLSGRKVIVFVGSDYPPNREAVSHLFHLAGGLGQDTCFLVVGSVGRHFRSRNNIRITGLVTDVLPYLSVSDMAINPVTRGGGMHLKLLEYMSMGLPVLSTPVGLRGLENKEWGVVAAPLDEFPEKLSDILSDDRMRRRLSREGREEVKRQYSWEAVANRRAALFEKIMENKLSEPGS